MPRDVPYTDLTRQAGPLEFTRITRDVFRSRAALLDVLERNNPGRPIHLPNIDFGRHEIYLVGAGPRSSTGYKLEVVRVRDVAPDRQRAEPLGLTLQDVPAPGEHRDVRTLFGECLRRRETEAGRRAADDRRPSLEPEIHCGARYRGRLPRRVVEPAREGAVAGELPRERVVFDHERVGVQLRSGLVVAGDPAAHRVVFDRPLRRHGDRRSDA